MILFTGLHKDDLVATQDGEGCVLDGVAVEGGDGVDGRDG